MQREFDQSGKKGREGRKEGREKEGRGKERMIPKER